jgi:hypothetical protein
VAQVGDDTDPFAEADELERRKLRELQHRQFMTGPTAAAAQVWKHPS